MSSQLDELLFLIRQHQAYQELLKAVEAPEVKPYRAGESGQYEDWIFRSGRRLQHSYWRQFLIGEASQQERS